MNDIHRLQNFSQTCNTLDTMKKYLFIGIPAGKDLTRWHGRHAYLILSLVSAAIGAGLYALFNQ